MTTSLYTHPDCIAHDPGPHHPERPDRLRAVLAALEGPDFATLVRHDAPKAEVAQIALNHEAWYVEAVLANLPERGVVHLDADTAISPRSGDAALRAAGAVCAAIDEVMAGTVANSFCAVRPPGHHAEAGRAMGFCVFNSVAVGAKHARTAHGLKRVAVLDFDVHHGNGTQNSFWDDAALFYGSSHQSPFYPGSGAEDERGTRDNIANVELSAGAGSKEFRAGWTNRILPALDRFQPDLVIISAGFDAHDDDPLASLCLHEDDYTWITGEILKIAKSRAGGRLVSSLEGGYDLGALAASAAAHVRVLMAA
ncbi:MAG: histone deacetylase family protein [Rhodospirillales bacterium]|nr:histone deacetylase family protein [Rhodospirillales bacterium]